MKSMKRILAWVALALILLTSLAMTLTAWGSAPSYHEEALDYRANVSPADALMESESGMEEIWLVLVAAMMAIGVIGIVFTMLFTPHQG